MKALFEKFPGEIAGVILEPVVGNSGYIAPTKEFLQVQPTFLFTEALSRLYQMFRTLRSAIPWRKSQTYSAIVCALYWHT